MSKADQVREHADYISNNPNNAHAVAAALHLIADAMDGKCEDCGSRQASAVIDPADNPEAGKDVGTVAAGVIAKTEQALAGDVIAESRDVGIMEVGLIAETEQELAGDADNVNAGA